MKSLTSSPVSGSTRRSRTRAHQALLSRSLLAGTLLVSTLVLAGCAGDSAPSDGRLRVVTTTGMIADAAERIAGEHAEVTALMGPGVDPHLYKASEGDVRRLADADLILYHGLLLEGAMAEILEKIGRTRTTVAVAEDIPTSELLDFSAAGKAYDPHVWFDVAQWASVIDPMVEALASQRPDLRSAFENNAAAFRTELTELDTWVEQAVAVIPDELRVLVTAHDAFGYFGRRYGFEVVGIQGISTASEAGLRDVERVVDLVVERRIPAIFVETSVSDRSIKAIVAAARDRGWDVEIGGQLYSDAMGPKGSTAGTYPGMVRSNVETLVNALSPVAAASTEPTS